MSSIFHLFRHDTERRERLAQSRVVPEPYRCVQCGMCSYNCPLGIDVRQHARQGLSIDESRCITCGECVARCPRGVLRFERIDLFVRSPLEDD
ncbi:MAG: 4Fe-4S dicluster domain-containing protein [Anaerolineales bacterium]